MPIKWITEPWEQDRILSKMENGPVGAIPHSVIRPRRPSRSARPARGCEAKTKVTRHSPGR
jgi:hypothetical protein